MENKYRRCAWCTGDSLYEQYHDQEWGVPVFDDLKLFEFLTLEDLPSRSELDHCITEKRKFQKCI